MNPGTLFYTFIYTDFYAFHPMVVSECSEYYMGFTLPKCPNHTNASYNTQKTPPAYVFLSTRMRENHCSTHTFFPLCCMVRLYGV